MTMSGVTLTGALRSAYTISKIDSAAVANTASDILTNLLITK
jgi:hypothetical protein